MDKIQEIDWDSLTFANNYVFLEVMNDKKRCRYMVEKILHIPVEKIQDIVVERHTNSPRISSKSIRLDCYLQIQDGTVITLEMQVTGAGSTIYRDKDETKVIKELPLRTRYYQSLISMDMLRRGMKYRELRKAYVVFICTFAPFGQGLPIYHFTYRSKENDALEMGDLTENIFLNAKAAEKTNDAELSAFLRYVNEGIAENKFTQELDEQTQRVKRDADWRERVVTWEMDLAIMQEDAMERGKKAGIQEGIQEGRREMKRKMAEVADALRKRGDISEEEIAEITKVAGDKPAQQC